MDDSTKITDTDIDVALISLTLWDQDEDSISLRNLLIEASNAGQNAVYAFQERQRGLFCF